MMGTLVHARQRRALRRPMRVECQVVRERGFTLVGSRAVDLSPYGMLVMAQERVLTGEPVLITFRLPRTSWWFDAEATVARVAHGRRPGDLGRCFAVDFETLGHEARTFLGLALRRLPPTLPTREPRFDYAASVRLAASS